MKASAQHIRAVVFLSLTALLWSTGGVLIKQVSWNAPAIAGSRCLLAAAVLLAIVRRRHLTFSRAQITGAVAYAVTVILFVAANKMTTAANAILLQYTAPVFVAILSIYFLHERVDGRDGLLIAAAMAGLVFFFLDRLGPGYWRGNVLAVLSGASMAVMIVAMRLQKDAFPLGSVFLGNLLVGLLTAPFLFLSPPRDPAAWLMLGFLGVFQLGLSYVLYGLAIRHVSALEAIMIPIIEPILNPVWVLLLTGERPGPWALLGGLIVLGSAVGYMIRGAAKAK
jgi:drug/metabolite transporter (DMT)-like permease